MKQMLSSVQVETIFLISVLVHVETAGQTRCLVFFPHHNIHIHTENLCPIVIFHSRQWELKDEVSNMCFHNKNDTKKHKSY